MVRERFALTPAIEAMAQDHAQTLYEQFGLCSDEAPSVDSLRDAPVRHPHGVSG